MRVSRVSVLLAFCCRGTNTQILAADELDHVSLLQTHVHRRSVTDGVNEPDLNALQNQLDKLQRKVVTASHIHKAKMERKSMMMVDLQSTSPDKEIKAHKATATGSKKHKENQKVEKKPPAKLDKFAKASLAKADKAEDMERSAVASIMDNEADELADEESHVLSAGALDQLEQVAERVARSKDQDEGRQELTLDEQRDDERLDQHERTKGKDKYHHKSKKDQQKAKHEKDIDEDDDREDAIDPEAELVRLAQQRAKREEAKAQLAESAAKDAWLELEKFQAARNIDSFPVGDRIASSAPGTASKKASTHHNKKHRGR